MMKEEEQKLHKKPWKKARRRRGDDWSGKNRSHEQEDGLRQIRKERKGNRIDWQELLMEEEYDLDDG
jgi:hypothetical protein